ncbi:MAG: spheroidene monooxygenase [Flavobacteriaceae bacterium TMED238]|nr:spheroidene monooxygenase [Flavobacteriaceae bacterium]RPG62407.1 MAG: spheroidene monooxygenase [Flavobacteriaceae bacterium TMED238]
MTTISFFKYSTNKFWAFKQMYLAEKLMNKTSGLSFYKLLGTGAGAGFSLYPDFSTYSILCVWKDRLSADNFINKSHHSILISKKASFRADYFLNPIHSHGKWDGLNPFKGTTIVQDKSKKIAIITRATLNYSRLLEFWKSVPRASKAIKNASGVIWFKGIGELPFIQQATFSIWENMDSVTDFAYKNKNHAEIVKKTRQRNWYKEDLFARFDIIEKKNKVFNN